MASAHVETNNLTLIRLAAAWAVIYSHSYELLGRLDQIERHMPQISFGFIAVTAFFVLSGFLVAQSYRRRDNLMAFIEARVLRILPGLWVMLVVSVLGVAVVCGDAGVVRRSLGYVLSNASVLLTRFQIPGAFDHLHNDAINGSLWTLRYEVLCYGIVALLGVSGILKRTALSFVCVAVLTLLFFVLKTTKLPEMGVLFTAFSIGLVWALLSDSGKAPFWGPLVGAIGLAVAPLAFSLPVFIATLVFWIGYVPAPAWLRRAPDISYGLYIYAFPVQQSFYLLFPGMTPPINFLLSTVVTACFASLSWFFVEKPALGAKGTSERWLSSRRVAAVPEKFALERSPIAKFNKVEP